MALTTKKRLFADEYLKDFNATQAAIRAGYSEKTAHSQGSRLLRDVDIDELVNTYIESVAVGRNERLILLSEIARDGEKDSDRLNAIEKLGKLAGDYMEKVEHSGGLVVEYVNDWRKD